MGSPQGQPEAMPPDAAALQEDVSGLHARFANPRPQQDGKCQVGRAIAGEAAEVLSGARQKRDVAEALAGGTPRPPGSAAGHPC